MAKTLYHSALKAMGLVKVTVLSEVRKSKFPAKDGGPKYYVELSINGQAHNYEPENDGCREYWTGLKGRTFTMTAEGSREDALLNYVGETMGEPPPEQANKPSNLERLGQHANRLPTTAKPPKTPPAQSGNRPPSVAGQPPASVPSHESAPTGTQNEPPAKNQPPARPPKQPETEADRVRDVKRLEVQMVNLGLIAYAGANQYRLQVAEQFGQQLSEQAIDSFAMNNLIQMQRSSRHFELPTDHFIRVGPAKEPAAADPAPAQ